MDFSTSEGILFSLENTSYLLLFLIFLIEGPLTNYVAAFAASLGFFNIFIIFILAVLGNVVADLAYYFLGRFGNRGLIEKYVTKSIGLKKLIKIKKYFRYHLGKTLVVIKLTPPLTLSGLVLAGAAHMPLKRFLSFSVMISLAMCIIITVAGYYSGSAFNMMYDYFKYGAVLAGVLISLVILLWWILSKRISNKIEKI